MKPIKLFFTTTIALCSCVVAGAQVKIGDNHTNICTSCLLELESPTKCLKLTGVFDTTRIAAPMEGMMVYDSASKAVRVYQSGKWNRFAKMKLPTPGKKPQAPNKKLPAQNFLLETCIANTKNPLLTSV